MVDYLMFYMIILVFKIRVKFPLAQLPNCCSYNKIILNVPEDTIRNYMTDNDIFGIM